MQMRLIDFLRDYMEAAEDAKAQRANSSPAAQGKPKPYRLKHHR